MLNKSILSAGVGLMISAVAAQAVPIKTAPPTLSAFGNVTAVYIFDDAANTSVLNEISPAAFPQIFCNHATSTCVESTPGETKNLFPPPQTGAMVFSLQNVTTGTLFTSNLADADGNYHVRITSNYADFGLGALPGPAAAALVGLSSITFIGWEDLTLGQGSDFDYNDLVFAFANTAVTGVPEPLTLSLFGAGLVGAAWMSRRKKSAKS